MSSASSNPPRPPGSARAKTDVSRRSQRKRTPKPPSAAPSTRRSAPAQFAPPFVFPVTPASFFFPVTVELFPGDHPLLASPAAAPPTAEYDAAITRLDELVTDSTLTPAQKSLLESALGTAQTLGTRDLLHTLSSPLTRASHILSLATTTDSGLRAFIAHPGPSTTTSSITRSRRTLVKTACASRDNSTCVVTGRCLGASCHIIPFSVSGEKAAHFWAFVALFKGRSATALLKTMALGSAPCSTDSIRNVLWMSPEAHSCFDSGLLCIVPVLAADAEYDPATVTEYSARIELPYGAARVDLSVWTTSASGARQNSILISGHTITLRTHDPARLPLPHPLLLQLHAAFTRLRRMCAGAGIPILPSAASSEDDEEMEEMEEGMSQDLQEEEEECAPRFAENDGCVQGGGAKGLPLKERFLSLLGARSEREVYWGVMQHWAESVEGVEDGVEERWVVPRKRRWDGSVGGRSRRTSEEGRGNRWDWKGVGGVAA